MTGNKG